MIRRVVLVKTDVSEASNVSIIRVITGELGTLAVNSKRRTLRRTTYYIIFFRSVRQLLVTANVAPSSQIPVILMMEALRSSETSVSTRATRRHIPEDDMLYSHRRENLKSHIFYDGEYNINCYISLKINYRSYQLVLLVPNGHRQFSWQGTHPLRRTCRRQHQRRIGLRSEHSVCTLGDSKWL
jgi:hypothetical protein